MQVLCMKLLLRPGHKHFLTLQCLLESYDSEFEAVRFKGITLLYQAQLPFSS